jgi:hypothetical protein
VVKVYYARVRDSSRAEMTVTPHKGTAEWIDRIGGEKILDTVEEVNESDLDAQGRYVPERRRS